MTPIAASGRANAKAINISTRVKPASMIVCMPHSDENVTPPAQITS